MKAYYCNGLLSLPTYVDGLGYAAVGRNVVGNGLGQDMVSGGLQILDYQLPVTSLKLLLGLLALDRKLQGLL